MSPVPVGRRGGEGTGSTRQPGVRARKSDVKTPAPPVSKEPKIARYAIVPNGAERNSETISIRAANDARAVAIAAEASDQDEQHAGGQQVGERVGADGGRNGSEHRDADHGHWDRGGQMRLKH